MIIVQVDAVWDEACEVSDVLQRLGHTVITLHSVHSPCLVTPDMVILDMRPGEGDEDVQLALARARWPRPILIVSHYLSDTCARADGYLHKRRLSHESLGSALARLQAA